VNWFTRRISPVLPTRLKLWPSKKQWRSWTLPSKASFLGLLLAIAGLVWAIATYFIPLATLLPNPPKAVPNVVAHILNSSTTNVFVATRGQLWLWTPSNTRYFESYDLAPTDLGVLHKGLVDVKPHQDTVVAITLLNQQTLYPLMKRGDLDLQIWFTRNDGSVFSSQGSFPFEESTLRRYSLSADANPNAKGN